MPQQQPIKLWELAGEDPLISMSQLVWRVRLLLAHKGQVYESIPWRFMEKKAIQPFDTVRMCSPVTLHNLEHNLPAVADTSSGCSPASPDACYSQCTVVTSCPAWPNGGGKLATYAMGIKAAFTKAASKEAKVHVIHIVTLVSLQVPVMDFHGKQMGESLDICKLLEKEFPEPAVFNTSCPAGRLSVALAHLRHAAIYQCFACTLFSWTIDFHVSAVQGM